MTIGSSCDSGDDALYRELWHACAGPLAMVPRRGELVYYFPQGHIEQVFLMFQFKVCLFFDDSFYLLPACYNSRKLGARVKLQAQLLI